jgi:hypothetical protein
MFVVRGTSTRRSAKSGPAHEFVQQHYCWTLEKSVLTEGGLTRSHFQPLSRTFMKHFYAIRMRPGSGTVISAGKQRSLIALRIPSE